MKKYVAILSIALLAGGLTSQAQAFDWFGGRLSLGGGYGLVKPKLPYSFQDSNEAGPMWTANVKYFINNDVSVVASYADLRAKSRTSSNDVIFHPVIGSVRYNIFHHLPITPYITVGAGAGFNKIENPDGTSTKWTKLALQGGLGLEFFINQQTSIGAEALYHNFVANDNNVPYRLASLVGTVNIYFGDGPETRRAKEEAEKQKQRADAAQQQALAAQQQTLNAQQQTQNAQQQMTAAEQAAAAQRAADAQKALAAQQAMQAQAQQAQSEIDQVKAMVAHKDIPAINFKTGSTELLVDSHAALDKVAAIAKKYPTLKLRVEGHTDSVGSAESNQKLSQRRAEAVRDYLVSSAGVPSDQITPVGFGLTRPVADNSTAEGRSQNRRVEFIFFLQ